MLKVKTNSSVIIFFLFATSLFSMESEHSTQRKIRIHTVAKISDVFKLISKKYGENGVSVTYDFDDMLFSRAIILNNGKTIQFLEKSGWQDITSHNGGNHPIFIEVDKLLGLNLVQTNRNFKTIRNAFVTSANDPLAIKEQQYHHVEGNGSDGIHELKLSIRDLQDKGAFSCIASAGVMDEATAKIKKDLARIELGILDRFFLSGANKFELTVALLGTNGKEKLHPTAKINTLILVDDSMEYINAWIKSAEKLSLNHSIIEPKRNKALNIVGIHYDFMGQNKELIIKMMVKEFKNLYGEDYKKLAPMKQFLR